MTGREIQAAVRAYLTARGWRQRGAADSVYWTDPRAQERGSTWHWSAALDMEADREMAQLVASAGATAKGGRP